jgi:antitoxin ParD1/3/4
MPNLNLELTSEMSAFVEREVSSGDYASASEVVQDALRTLRREQEADVLKLEILRRKLAGSIAAAERGEFSNRDVMDIAAAVLAEDDD